MQKPDIGIVFPIYMPESFEETIVSEIANEQLNLVLKRKKPQAWASIEWAIPGLIAAYLFKPYFESFLKEAGKDHYNLLKGCLVKLLKKGKETKMKTIVANSTPDKKANGNTQSKAISIHIEIKDKRKIKLLFDNELELTDWINALSSITVSYTHLTLPTKRIV